MSKVKVGFVALLALLLTAVPAVADAKFTAKVKPAAAISITSDILNPPTPTTTKPVVSCISGDTRVAWNITPDTYADGYTLYGKYGTYAEVAIDVSGRTTLSYTYPDAVPSGTVISVVATKANWTSVRTPSYTTTVNCG